jgi:hypothetical protein
MVSPLARILATGEFDEDQVSEEIGAMVGEVYDPTEEFR